jgi:type I restriction enzyme S subunit
MTGSRHDEFLAALPRRWEKVSIDDLGDLVGGGTPSRANPAYWGGDIPWVTPGEVTELNGSKYIRHTRERITQAGLAGSAAKLLPQGSVLITTRATLGAVAIAGVRLTTNQGFRTLVPNSSADSDFYFHLFKLVASEFKRLGSGSTFDEISRRLLGAVVLPRPEVDEQRAIAHILDAADQAMEAVERRIKKLSMIRLGFVAELLSRGLSSSGELRSETDDLVDSDDVGRHPADWSVDQLASVVDRDRPIVYGVLMPGRGYDGPGAVPVIKVKDIIGGQVMKDGLLRTTPEIDQEYRRSRLAAGDLLFTIRGTVGRMAFVPASLDGANITQDTARIAVKGANSIYVREWLDSFSARKFVDLNTIGQAVRGINLGALRKLPIALPPLDEQDAIAAAIGAFDSTLSLEKERLRELTSIKLGLARDLLSGAVEADLAMAEKAA